MSVMDKFTLKDKTYIITGGLGLLGIMHAESIVDAGGNVVLWDVHKVDIANLTNKSTNMRLQVVDICSENAIESALNKLRCEGIRIHGLINNAANNPQVNEKSDKEFSRLENFKLNNWNNDIAVGLTGAFLSSKYVGQEILKSGGGVILNIASDLGVIAPNQSLYQKEGIPPENQAVKPITYSVVKHGLIGLSKYLATYWAEQNIRVNTLAPGGVFTNQPEPFLEKLKPLIPMGRMADKEEYKAAIVFLLSDASSYMTGATLHMDGGRTCW